MRAAGPALIREQPRSTGPGAAFGFTLIVSLQNDRSRTARARNQLAASGTHSGYLRTQR
jgi:hypothetical protein